MLQSIKDGSRYVGNTKDVQARFRKHNKGDCRYTKGHRPWKIVYQEVVRSRTEAIKKERFLKSGVRLSGITIAPNAFQNFFRAHLLEPSVDKVGILEINMDRSRIDIFSHVISSYHEISRPVSVA